MPGWRIQLLCPPGPLADAASSSGIAVLTGAVSPSAGPRVASAEVRRAALRLRPSLIHSHLSFADLAVAVGTLGLPVSVVTTEHGIAADDLVYHGTRARSAVKAQAHRARLRRADAVIAVSRSTAAVIREKWKPPRSLRIHVIHNGVDRPTEPPKKEPGLEIVSLARLAPEKGLAHLIDAFSVVVERNSRAHLTIGGDGEMGDELRALVRSLGLSARVTFTGHVDAQALLQKGDVLAQLSTWENCSYSLLDALTHGLGVVATPVGGNPEILPARCLVDRTRPQAVADLLLNQGLDLSARPALGADWPTVDAMTCAIAEVYRDVVRG